MNLVPHDCAALVNPCLGFYPFFFFLKAKNLIWRRSCTNCDATFHHKNMRSWLLLQVRDSAKEQKQMAQSH